MKRILLYAAFSVCVFMGCNKTEKPSMAGVYKLDRQWISGGGTDSTYAKKQIKIYTSSQFIYAGITADSSVSFGVGNYKADTGGHVSETEFYSSYRLDTSRSFKLNVTTNATGFTQKIPAIATIKGVKYDLMESYTVIPSNDSTKMDGLWKMDKSYTINGKDTLKKIVIQYKIFQGGHFLFAGRYLADKAANKFKNNFGYGNFSLKGDSLIESNTMASDVSALTHKFNVTITFNGDNAYTQVITEPKNSQRSIETYVRVK